MSFIANDLYNVRQGRPRYARSLLRAFIRLLLWPIRVHRARQTLHQLSQMDVRELRDIGLTPYDVQSAEALPLDADPTMLLASRARERVRNEIEKRYY